MRQGLPDRKQQLPPEPVMLDRTEQARLDRTEQARLDRTERARLDRTEQARLEDSARGQGGWPDRQCSVRLAPALGEPVRAAAVEWVAGPPPRPPLTARTGLSSRQRC